MLLKNRFSKFLAAATAALFIFAQAAHGQREGDKAQGAEDVVRINTELVQTSVSVQDKKGKFVDGLKKEDFELKVDGKPVSISFFENVIAGSRREQALRAPKSEQSSPVRDENSATSFRRRTVIFFIDDLHLSLDSITRTRKMLLNFIEREMGQNDLVAIASASGRIGFLQQYTDNKDVLRAAVARLTHFPNTVMDNGRGGGQPMTEYMALSIERKEDPSVFKFYVDECVYLTPRMPRGNPRLGCEAEVKSRARQILTQSASVIASTYGALEILLRSAEQLPGSKLAFFISDGFLLDTGPRGLSLMDKLKQITDDALRAGVVVYSIDAKGLVSGASDATSSVPVDPNGTLESANSRAIPASQDAMNALAVNTGGRALRNQNQFTYWVSGVLEETSRYYLLAWRPEADEQKGEKFRKIEISVQGHPEFTVNNARGFFTSRTTASANEERPSNDDRGATKKDKSQDADLRQALSEFYPRQALPLQLSLVFIDTPSNGAVLTTSVQAPANLLSYGASGKEPAQLSLAGVVLNDQGKPAASFKTGLKVNPAPAAAGTQGAEASAVIYNSRAPLKPGIYQVRVAARDDLSGLVGSNMQWIVIPDLSQGQLSMSSMILGLESIPDRSAADGQIQWSVDKKFSHGSHLRFMTFVYNAMRFQGAPPNLAAQVQIYREGQAVVSTPFKTIALDAGVDMARVPFTGDINLKSLQAGRYVLRVNIEDNSARKTVSQQTAFYVQ
jgi:VWFA-related protein